MEYWKQISFMLLILKSIKLLILSRLTSRCHQLKPLSQHKGFTAVFIEISFHLNEQQDDARNISNS